MKKTRFTEAKIIKAIKEHENSRNTQKLTAWSWILSPPPSKSGASVTRDWK
ncbi:hypothetical protein [Pontibacter kalidii]|uniref:hypothetical protein n=1 Tax=Pontibacter kalidii TaxID=2592049 RepID=UPI00225A9AA4|nr:hypothetical protein [Pontibacter kalidii]